MCKQKVAGCSCSQCRLSSKTGKARSLSRDVAGGCGRLRGAWCSLRAERAMQRELLPFYGCSSSCVAGPLEHVHLSLPFVTTKNKEVNATAVLWPSQVGTLTYVWWYGNNTEVSRPPAWCLGTQVTEARGVLEEAKQDETSRGLGVAWLQRQGLPALRNPPPLHLCLPLCSPVDFSLH